MTLANSQSDTNLQKISDGIYRINLPLCLCEQQRILL